MRIVDTDRFAFAIRQREHQPLADVLVVWNRYEIGAGLDRGLSKPRPVILRIVTVKQRVPFGRVDDLFPHIGPDALGLKLRNGITRVRRTNEFGEKGLRVAGISIGLSALGNLGVRQ